MEIMAIIVAIILTPSTTPLKIYTDSQAAAHMMLRITTSTISRELINSPDAFLWLHLRSWLQSRQAPVSVQWIRGHSGVAGNETADRLAASAHNDPSVTQWTTRMPPPPEASFWIMHGDRAVPRRPRRIFREQDEAIISSQLIKQVNAVPHRPGQTPTEVEHILHTQRWTILPNGQTKMKKCWNSTSNRDSIMRSFGLKLLMRFLPTLDQQAAWYLDVSNRPELVQCAKCKQPGETTQVHLYDCSDQMDVKEECVQVRCCMLESRKNMHADMRMLRSWNSLG